MKGKNIQPDQMEFVANMIGSGQVTIPKVVKKALGLRRGDLVQITIEKVAL